MWIKGSILVLVGLSSSFVVSGAVFAFITVINVIPRLATRTKTAGHILLFENMILLGGGLGNAIMIFNLPITLGMPGMIIFGLFSGIYVGCFSIALAETLRVFPVFSRKFKIIIGVPYLVLAMALGKGFGAFYQLYFK